MARDDRPVCIFAFYLQIRGGGIFILYPVLNAQLTPVVTANRHFHVTAFSLPETFDWHVLFLRMMGVESQHELRNWREELRVSDAIFS